MGYLQKVIIFILSILIYPTLSLAQSAIKNTEAATDALNIAGQAVSPDDSKVYFDEQMALALKGDTSGMVGVAMGYQDGSGVEKDFKMALYWYEKAAQLNDVVALNELGTIYLDGANIPQDNAKGFAYELKCADLGGAICAYIVANKYYSGEIVPKNLKKAEEYYLKATKVKGYLKVHAHGAKDPQIYAAEELEKSFNYKCKIRGKDYNRYYVCRKHK